VAFTPTRPLRWFVRAFIGVTVTWLLLSHLRAVVPVPDRLMFGLIALSALALPFAFMDVFLNSDRASRRNWLLLLGLCGAIIILAIVFQQPA
jgi:hypothetical protein